MSINANQAIPCLAAVAVPLAVQPAADYADCRWQPLGFFTSKRQARRAVAAYMADHPECYSYVVLSQAGGLYDKLAARLQEEVRS